MNNKGCIVVILHYSNKKKKKERKKEKPPKGDKLNNSQIIHRVKRYSGLTNQNEKTISDIAEIQ